jgi:hypothetical protein
MTRIALAIADRPLERAAYHEAGHCAAAIAFGIPIIAVTIVADVPHVHRARYRAPGIVGLRSLVTMCLAGPAGERLFCGGDGALCGAPIGSRSTAPHQLPGRHEKPRPDRSDHGPGPVALTFLRATGGSADSRANGADFRRRQLNAEAAPVFPDRKRKAGARGAGRL